jgi:hypothetical protein
MSANSSACKAWCITLVSAILVIIADKGKPDLAWLALLPSVLFLALDAYYLALEKAFRLSYDDFIKKLHAGKLGPEDLFAVVPKGQITIHQLNSVKSFSVWGFYGALIILIILARELVLK